MQVIINCEKIVDVDCLKNAYKLTREYWEHPHNSWLYGSDAHYQSIIIEDGIPIGYLMGSNFMAWDDTEALKENSAMSNPFTNGSDCCKHWDKVKHNFIPVLEISDVNEEYHIAGIFYKDYEIYLIREQEDKKYPYVYFIDVFKNIIEKNDEAFDDDMSSSFSDINSIFDYLENNFDISKTILNKIENSSIYKKYLKEHHARLDDICRNIKGAY